MKRKLFTLLIMFLTMVGNAVWAEGDGSQSNPYTGTINTAITPTEDGTVYLKDAIITVNDGYALDLEDIRNFTLHVSGVCELRGQNNIALHIPGGNKGSVETFNIEGDGILRIYGLNGADPNDKIGDINVNSGTVYFLGDIGHDNGNDSGTINVQGGVTFIDGQVIGKAENTDGIIFTHVGNTWTGELLSNEYEITSNITGDIDGDGDSNDESILLNVPDGKTLSLGEGVVIDRNVNSNFTVTTSGTGVFKYFAVSYNANAVPNCATTSTAPVDNNYYGRNTTINVSEQEMTCSGNADVNGVHEFLGWVEDGDTDLKVGATSITTPESYTVNGRETVTFKAAWATKELNLTLTEGEAMPQNRALANQPEGVVSYTDSPAGLPTGIEFKDGAFSGTPGVGTSSTNGGVYSVSVTYTYTDIEGSEQTGTTAIKITVLSDAPNINDGTIKWADTNNGTYTYNNQQYKPITIEVDGESLIEGTHFTVKYNYTENETGTESKDKEGNTIVKMAGTYTVESISPIPGAAQGSEITNAQINYSDITITVNKRTINGYVVAQSVEIDNGSVNTTPTVRQNNTGTIYVSEATTETPNQGFAEGENSVVNIFIGTLSSTAPTPLAVGSYTLSAESIDLQDCDIDADNKFLKNNYEKGTITSGTLTVTDNLSDDDVETDIKDEDGDDENKPIEDENGAWTIIYDGKSHEITKVKKGDVEIPVTDEDGTANYTITYKYKASEDAEEDDVDLSAGGAIKNVGTYTATIEFKNGYTGTKTQTIIIKTRDLTVDLNIPESIEPEQSLDNLSDWWNKDMIKLDGIVTDEEDDAKASFTNASVSITGPLTSGEPVDVVVKNVKLEDKDSFLTSNYNITYKNGETTTISNWEDLDDIPNDGDENDTTIDDGTTVGKIEIDPSEDGDDITGGEDNTDPKDDDLDDKEDFVMIHPDGEGSISVYDGKPHGLAILKIGDYTLYEGEENGDYTVEYDAQEGTKAVDGETGKPLHAGKYTATVTLNEGNKYQIKDDEDNSFTLTIQIKERPLEVYLNIPATIKENQNLEDLSSWWNSSKITFNEGGFANDTEKEKAIEKLSNAKVSISKLPNVGESVAVTLTDIQLTDSDPFFASNYDITYKNGDTEVTLSNKDDDDTDDDAEIENGTTVDDSDKTVLDPDGDDKDNTTGGEDGEDDQFPSDDDFILLSPNTETSASVYDGQEHGLTILKIGEYVLREGTDYNEIETYTPTNNSQANVGSNGLPKHVNTYSATITLVEGSGYKWPGDAESYTLNGLTIKERLMLISFVSEVASEADLHDINKLIQYEPMVGDRGLVQYEQPIVDAEISNVEELSNGRYRVTIDRESFTISNNDGNFYLSDYAIALDADGDDSGDYNVTDEDKDGEGGLDDGNGDNDNDDDIIIDIIIDPNKPDFPDYPDFGGGGSHRPIEYYTIYQDTICPGIQLELSDDVVKGGDQVSVYLTVEAECDTMDWKFQYKRGLFGYWEDLKPYEGVQPGEYIIPNIHTDIYIRALDATMPDPTGLEEVEGAKVYTQDGNIYVYTPSRMPVWIVSMTGALLRNEEQVGLQSYDRLTRGIYIVRVGEQVFKIQLK